MISKLPGRSVLKRLAIRAGYRSEPSFLIIGAQKGGTTALYSYLAAHPRILPSRRKEIGFFVPEQFADWPQHPNHAVLCTPGGTVFDDRHSYRRALAWYHGHFPLPHRLHGAITFEATPDYLYYPEAARRIFEYRPGMKLLVLLRNPVERAFSAWQMYSRYGGYRPLIYAPKRETRPFDVAIRDDLSVGGRSVKASGAGYVRRGLYGEQLTRYFEWFVRRQVLVLESEELKRNTRHVLDQVMHFLELPAYRREGGWDRIHVGEYDSEIPAATGRLLAEFYQPFNQELYGMVGRDLGW